MDMFTHVLVNSQLSTPLLGTNPDDFPSTRNRGPLEEIFIKASRIDTLALGIAYFLNQTYGQGKKQKDTSTFIHWASKVAIETLRTGIDVVAAI
jgi:nucleolar MIF4G domain-containing protein 1